MNIEDTDEQTCDLIFFYLKQLAARNSLGFQGPWMMKREKEAEKKGTLVPTLGNLLQHYPVTQLLLCLLME